MAIALLSWTAVAWSQPLRRPAFGITNPNSRFGIGLVLGSPTGVAWKYWLTRTSALDGAIGLAPYDEFRFHVDYLTHTFPFESQYLSIYYGGGAAVGGGVSRDYYYWRDGLWIARDTRLGFGARGVLGVVGMIPSTPLDAFLEIAPIFILTPSPVGFVLDFDLGTRVYL
jgi:hypothetical protein